MRKECVINQIKNARNVRKDKHDGKIYFEFDGQPDEVFLGVRTGLGWPNKSAPAYYCMLAQLARQNEFKKYPLVFLSEGQSKDLNLLLDKLTDDAKRLLCREIYVDLTENRKCFRDLFSDYCEETETRGLRLNRAPWPENFSYGLHFIRDWVQKKALKIESGTTLARQMGKISEDLLEDPAKAEVDFYAVNALRYVLGAFQKYPWRAPLQDIDYGSPYNYAGYFKGINI